MSKVVKYFYTSPVMKGTVAYNPILGKTIVAGTRLSRRYTIAAVYDDDNKTIKFGLSVCLPQDNFCKATGRKISEKNALEKPFHVIEGFNGRRNEYADEVMEIFLKTERKLLKRESPNIFNPKYFID